ncbi:MAG: Stk1 family PASTA domain-containing Ser/Thr kinase [Bacillota bacterium]|nr:Stk1 family PASTA domain-containing Ser/Thr kinase [Bacillota bacterium]
MDKKVLNNRYEIIEKIGGGGMAEVYKARCRVLNRNVAIKVLRGEFVEDEEFISKFKDESQAAAKLNHNNIVNIYDTGLDGDIHYIVMEYVEGMTLKEYIKDNKPLDIKESINIASQIAEALRHAHSNKIIHRDIKPQNILITEEKLAKVGDFGIARAISEKTITNSDKSIGSVHYFSPEQARGGYVDNRTDIYSLGVVLFEMVTGRVPFDGDTPISVALKHVNENISKPSKYNEKIPAKLEEIILKSTNKSQRLRYHNIDEMIEDLKNVFEPNTKSVFIPSEEDLEKEEALRKFFESDSSDNNIKNKKAAKINDVEEEDDIKEPRNNKKLKMTILAVILALAITGTFTILAVNYIKDYLITEEFEMPNIVGLDAEAAEAQIKELGLNFEIEDRIYNSNFAEGEVITQNIKPESKVKEGFPIKVIVSLGEKLVEVPEIVNEHSNEGLILIREAGLEEGEITYEFSEEIPWGLIIRQNPEAGEKVSVGEEISYVVSKGPEVEYLLMPNLIGLTQEEAERSILSKGFKIGTISERSNDEHDSGIVYYQSYPAGTEIEVGTSIDIIVSTGPEATPDEGDTTTDSGVEGQLDEKMLMIELPSDRETIAVIVERITDDTRENVYTGTHNSEEESISIPVTGYGLQKFEIFIDSEFIESREINFGE